ncbi:hypothetical protein U1Q18_006078 [Sarracenia purpurea var. burkii]
MEEPKMQQGESEHGNMSSRLLNSEADHGSQKAQSNLSDGPITQRPLLNPNSNSMDLGPRPGNDIPDPNQVYAPVAQRMQAWEEQLQNLSRDRKWKRRAREAKGEKKFKPTGVKKESAENLASAGEMMRRRKVMEAKRGRGWKRANQMPSDHLPLVVSEIGLNNSGKKRIMKKIYRFEHMWTRSDECRLTIQNSWGEGNNISTMYEVKEKLGKVSEALSKWNWEKFGHIQNRIKCLKEELAMATSTNNLLSNPEREVLFSSLLPAHDLAKLLPWVLVWPFGSLLPSVLVCCADPLICPSASAAECLALLLPFGLGTSQAR